MFVFAVCSHACLFVYGFASLVRFVSFSKLFAFLVSLHVSSSVLGCVLFVYESACDLYLLFLVCFSVREVL